MLSNLIGVGLLLTPFITRFSEQYDVRMGKNSFLFMLIPLILFCSSELRQNKKTALLLGILAFNSFFFTYNYISLRYFIQHTFFITGIMLFYVLSTSQLNIKTILKYIRTLGAIQTILVSFNYFGIDLYYKTLALFYSSEYTMNPKSKGLILGSLGNSNTVGALIALTTPAFLGTRLFFVPIIGALISSSSMAVLTVLGCFLYYYYNKRFNKFLPWLALILTGTAFGLLGFPTGYFSSTHRLRVWNISIDLLQGVEFLTGRGLGAFAEAMKNYKIPFIYQHIHNEYLEVLHAFGLVGCLIIGLLVFDSIKRTKNNIILSGMFATAINSYGNFTFHISATAFLGLIYFAIATKDDKCLGLGTVKHY